MRASPREFNATLLAVAAMPRATVDGAARRRGKILYSSDLPFPGRPWVSSPLIFAAVIFLFFLFDNHARNPVKARTVEDVMKMLRVTFFAAATLICSTQAYAVMYLARPYEPNMARWLTRDPIGERGGMNLYGFVGNNPISRFDAFGLTDQQCNKCGVKSARLEVLGVSWSAMDFDFIVVEKVVLRAGLPYDHNCCAIFKWQKSRDVVNGKSVPTAAGGSPLDGHWHLDVRSWMNDDINMSNVHPMEFAGGTPGVDVTFLGYDAPGICGSGDTPIPPGTTWSHRMKLKLEVRDRCHSFKKVATSNVVSMRARGTWPDIHYNYSN